MENFRRINADEINTLAKPGKKILFANVPADGHFNPLTSLAMHLKNIGCDVRWYGSTQYAGKAEKLGIQYYSFIKAKEIVPETFDQDFPERAKLNGVVAKLKFDIINFFILRGPEYYADIMDIHNTFAFDLMICDVAFSAIPFVREKMNIPVISVSVFPLTETSKDLAPYGLAMHPAKTFFGRRKQDLLRILSDNVLFRQPNQVMRKVLGEYGIAAEGNVFHVLVSKSTLVLQSGSPGFEYKRSDIGSNIRFIGAVLPYVKKTSQPHWYNTKLEQYKRVVLVTQGTVEKDINKLLVPTLEAFQNSDVLVIATTG
ncbi:MAG TPA: glycosyltransferase, partial [Chitinophagaceae bacterium]|nr:glycosyltransferase [Chitinophagaceae bacterium]